MLACFIYLQFILLLFILVLLFLFNITKYPCERNIPKLINTQYTQFDNREYFLMCNVQSKKLSKKYANTMFAQSIPYVVKRFMCLQYYSPSPNELSRLS